MESISVKVLLDFSFYNIFMGLFFIITYSGKSIYEWILWIIFCVFLSFLIKLAMKLLSSLYALFPSLLHTLITKVLIFFMSTWSALYRFIFSKCIYFLSFCLFSYLPASPLFSLLSCYLFAYFRCLHSLFSNTVAFMSCFHT